MLTKDEAVKAAQEAAHHTGRPMFVFSIHPGSYNYGSQSWLERMNPKPRVFEILWPDREETKRFAQEEANRIGRSVCLFTDMLTLNYTSVSEWREEMREQPAKYTEVPPNVSTTS